MILDIAARRADLSPKRQALYWQGQWLTYAELNERARRLAAALSQQGIRAGDRVSILAENHLAHIELILATAKLGFIYTPLNYRLSLTEQLAIVRYVRPGFLLYDQANRRVAEQLALRGCALANYEAFLASGTAVTSAEPRPEDTQMILFTGGTTGLPKGACISYRQNFYNAVNTVMSWGLRADDCAIQATPCFHAAVNVFSLPLFHLGGRIALQLSFSAEGYLRLLSETSASLMFLVPTMYTMLVDDPGFQDQDFSHVRWAISGGAACPEPVRLAFKERGVRFKQGYGLTEAGVNCFSIELPEAEQKPNAVGKPILHSEAVIRQKDGQPVAQGEVGELTLRGSHVFSGYFERPEATAEALKDGWLWTGDLAQQDDEGLYYIVGRRKEMFISGGENIYPTEIEAALYEHPAVAECAVVGVADARWGEVGLAVLSCRYTVSLEQLKDHLRSHLASYKIPKHFRMVESLPKSGAGKILKSQLKDNFEATQGEEV